MPNDLQKGDTLTADWLRALSREVRRNNVTAGHGLRETQTANGKIISLARPPPRPAHAVKSWPYGAQYAFGILISGADVTIYPGAIESGGSAYSTAEATKTIIADGQYVGVALDRSLGTAKITGPHNARPVASSATWATALYSFDFADGIITAFHDHIHDIRLDAAI